MRAPSRAMRAPDVPAAALAVSSAKFLQSKIAEEVSVFDMREVSSASDFFVLATCRSSTHLAALCDQMEDNLKDAGYPVHREGKESVHWRLLDAGGITVHLFSRWARRFYALDDLWVDAKRIKIS